MQQIRNSFVNIEITGQFYNTFGNLGNFNDFYNLASKMNILTVKHIFKINIRKFTKLAAKKIKM